MSLPIRIGVQLQPQGRTDLPHPDRRAGQLQLLPQPRTAGRHGQHLIGGGGEKKTLRLVALMTVGCHGPDYDLGPAQTLIR